MCRVACNAGPTFVVGASGAGIAAMPRHASVPAPPAPAVINPDRRLINGHPSTLPLLHQSLADAAAAYLQQQQRSKCTNETKLLFARFDWHGLGNDVNNAVRALSTAVIQERQIVFLPPHVSDRKDHPWMTQMGLSATHPWHWLAGAGMPFGSMIVQSACEKMLHEYEDGRLIRIIAEGNESDPGTTLFRMGEKQLAARSRAWKPIWRVGLHAGSIPLPFRSHGLLWWFQVLSSYLVRVRPPLSTHLERHPAMRSFLQSPAGLASATDCGPKSIRAAAAATSGWNGTERLSCVSHNPLAAAPFGRTWCKRRWCDNVGPSWFPPVWFDVGLHLRIGDVCGKHAALRGQKARKCSSQPTEEAFELMRSHGLRGRLFFASDSREAVDTAVKIGPSYGFTVAHLSYDRSRIEGEVLDANGHAIGTELVKRSRARDLAVLTESLMDVLLLSRSSVLVGSMMSNFPRMALQLRVQAPIAGEERYFALDGRTWCTRSSCRMNYSDHFGTVR